MRAIQKWAKVIMKIEDGLIVLLDYQLSDGEGSPIDESLADEPLAYLHGAAGIIPALESELQGMSEGEAFDITIAPEDAYGEYRPEAVTQVPRANIPADWDLELGLRIEDSTGETPPQVVTGINQNYVTLDANHGLAGLTLRFKGTVREVREATAEERESVGDL